MSSVDLLKIGQWSVPLLTMNGVPVIALDAPKGASLCRSADASRIHVSRLRATNASQCKRPTRHTVGAQWPVLIPHLVDNLDACLQVVVGHLGVGKDLPQ